MRLILPLPKHMADCARLAAGHIPEAPGAELLDVPLASEDGRIDINDLYFFQWPVEPGNTVFIMKVNPLAEVMSDASFRPRADCQFLVDNDGDAEPGVDYIASLLANPSLGCQDVLVERVDSSAAVPSGDVDYAAKVTEILPADVLTFDTASSMGFLNCRGLAYDMIDVELGLPTRGALVGEGVDANDVPFANAAPYVVPALPVPEPGALTHPAAWQ